jgi:hypothetical protein
MKLKILSLVLIALLAISSVSSVNAGTVYTHYPLDGFYRYSGDNVGIAISFSSEQYSDGTDFNELAYPIIGRLIAPGDYRTKYYLVHDYGNKWQQGHYNAVNIPSECIGRNLYINVWDGSSMSLHHSHVRIWNYQNDTVNLAYYDRGGEWDYRDPHVEIWYKGSFYDGGEGEDINIY